MAIAGKVMLDIISKSVTIRVFIPPLCPSTLYMRACAALNFLFLLNLTETGRAHRVQSRTGLILYFLVSSAK